MTGNDNSEWKQIKQSYSTYLQQSKDNTGISIGEIDTGYPLRDAILQDMSVSITRPRIAREHLITGNPEIPPIDELSPNILTKVSAELSNILQVAITQDHLDLWEWTYDLLGEMSQGNNSFIDQNIWLNIQTLFDLALCDGGSPTGTREEKILFQTNFIAGYVAYPILEGLLKRLCSNDLKEDGTVRTADTVYNLSNKRYYYSGDHCNSLTDILYHFENEVANEFLSDELEQHREYVAKFSDDVSQETAYGLIYDWRNSIVHGQNQADVQYGISLNIICMIVWNYIAENTPITGSWEA